MVGEDEGQDTPLNEDEGVRLKYAQRGIRSSITRYDNQAGDILTNTDPGLADEKILIKIAFIQSTVQKKLQSLDVIDKKLILQCPAGEIEKIMEESGDVTACVMETIHKSESFVKKAEGKTSERAMNLPIPLTTSSPIMPVPAVTAIRNTSNKPSSSSQSNGVSLPKITLPRFNGDIMRFYSFYQSFERSIDKNKSLLPVDKFNYLVNILEGEVFRAIQGLEIVQENQEKPNLTFGL